MIRPGPETIDAGQAPDGVVLRFYDVADGNLIVEQRIYVPSDLFSLADQARDQLDRRARPGPIVLAVYDGDTGQRWSADDYRACGFQPGDLLG